MYAHVAMVFAAFFKVFNRSAPRREGIIFCQDATWDSVDSPKASLRRPFRVSSARTVTPLWADMVRSPRAISRVMTRLTAILGECRFLEQFNWQYKVQCAVERIDQIMDKG